MKLFIALLIIVFLAFSGYHLTFRKFRLPLFTREFYLTGLEFLFLGLLLGPGFLDLIDTATMKKLEPLTALLLGWIGLLCGFQLELKAIRKFPSAYLNSSLTESLLTFGIVFTGCYFMLPLHLTLSDTIRIIASITLAAAAACSAQTGLSLLTSDVLKKRAETVNFLRYISSIDSIVALLLFLPVFLFQYPTIDTPDRIPSFVIIIIVVLATNAGLLLLYNLFLVRRRNIAELALVLIGMTVFTSGAASMLNFSPLLANFLIGTFLVNTTREKERIFSILVGIEKPVYLLLLVFIGANWSPSSFWMVPAAVFYALIRFGGKLTGGFLASRLSYNQVSVQGSLGAALLEQGGVPLAILFDFQQGFPGQEISAIVSIAIISLIINDLLSPHLIDRLLNDNSTDNNLQRKEK